MTRKLCPGCGVEKDIDAFNYKVKSKGLRQVRCRECTRLQVQQHYKRNTAYYVKKARQRNDQTKILQREQILAYLSTHPCVDCGERDIVCLEFDHVSGQKVRNIANMIGECKWATIEAEIAKCEVRCANCHRRKTARQHGYWSAQLNMRP